MSKLNVHVKAWTTSYLFVQVTLNTSGNGYKKYHAFFMCVCEQRNSSVRQ